MKPTASRGLRAAGAALALALALAPAAAADRHPTTQFEETKGAVWTSHERELDFLAEVDERAERAAIDGIGTTEGRRPLQLVRIGAVQPPTEKKALRSPTLLYICSQHGNEPAGREACLSLLRDLALGEDPQLVRALEGANVLFVPTANPDGRAQNRRGNASGVDVNRDHLNLRTAEAKAIARVVRDWQPDVVIDLHEYGPSVPAVYDDELLYLWPRNLNVDGEVHDAAENLGRYWLKRDAEAAGYSVDEYGQWALADRDIHQTAGGGDEGILRNTMGLRHALGILVESAVSRDPRNDGELADESAVNRRRVASHAVVARSALAYLGRHGAHAARVTDGARERKTREGRDGSAPVFFGGADNEAPAEEDVVFPPPCGYELTPQQYDDVAPTLELLGAEVRRRWDGGALVSLGQPAEPVLPLLLDARGNRSGVEGRPLEDC